MKISIIIPIYNEVDNLDKLFERLEGTLNGEVITYEIIAVNDGSSDNTWEKLKTHVQRNPKIQAINFQRNYGQTAAIAAGIADSTGEGIVPIDADLENERALARPVAN